MSQACVIAQGVGKRYEVFESARGRLLHAMFPRYRRGMHEVWALRDVDFELERGGSLAIIGRNGGGKSTLLQILTGVLQPTAGSTRVHGRVGALLELGSGFNPEYSGRDNVLMNGLLLGLTRESIRSRMGEILDFAEIGEAIDRPVKTYSTGMMMRLAFAVQAMTRPDILIIDEALSVGDFFFQQKCLEYVRELGQQGVTLLFVSHDMATVRDLCQRALYLREGRMEYLGDTTVAIRRFMAERAGRVAVAATPERGHAARTPAPVPVPEPLWSVASPIRDIAPGKLVAVGLYDAEGHASTSYELGAEMTVRVAYRPPLDAAGHVAVTLRNKFNQVVTSLGSSRLGLAPPAAAPGELVVFEMRVQLHLEAGNYSLTVGLGHLVSPNLGQNLDSTPELGPVVIRFDYEGRQAPFLGMVGLPTTGTFSVVAGDEKGMHEEVA
jgi:lipopolysaccharide transport system ATP-binding protein